MSFSEKDYVWQKGEKQSASIPKNNIKNYLLSSMNATEEEFKEWDFEFYRRIKINCCFPIYNIF